MKSYRPYARYLSELFFNDSNFDADNDLTNLKMQKMLYYIQGWSLVRHSHPAFHNKIEAWEHGPVVVDAYQEFKKFGKNVINPQDICSDEELSDKQREITRLVFETYRGYSPWGLRDLTYRETPWKSVDIKDEITCQSMADFFRSIDDGQ